MELETALLAPESWTRLTIASICVRFTSGGTPSRQRPEYYVNGTIPWVKTQELSDWVLYDTEERITPDALAASSAKLLPPNTVLMAMYGATVGQLGILGREMACNQACAAMVIDPSIADYRFVFYQLLANRRQIKSLATGAAQQNLSGSQVKEFVLAFPSLPEQKAIADFLWTIDCRRALLRETNLTLESVAEAIFKSWFVDFEPVHAKAAGRDPKGMDAETAALFPSEFEDSELGPIPKGWQCRALGEAFEINPVRRLRKGTLAPYLDMANTPTQGHRPGTIVLREVASGVKFMNGDTLLARITPCLENGKTAFVDFLAEGQVGWGSTEFVVMRPRPPLPLFFGYLLAKEPTFRAYAARTMTGSSGRQRIDINALAAYKVAVPDVQVAKAFERLVEPLRLRIVVGNEQARTLADLRDTLLPHLISGKLRLPEVEDIVKEVAS